MWASRFLQLILSLHVVIAYAHAQTVESTNAAQNASLFAIGERIYREGIGSSGEPIRGAAPGGVVLKGSEGACVVCHRRSGYGGSEGRFNIRPIIGPALFDEQAVVLHSPRIKAQLGARLRPPYDDTLLGRAIRGGVDSAGKPLDTVMPRFNLSEKDVKAVSVYLAALSATASPGVDAEEIHFATVIQPGVAAEKRRAMLTILETFFSDKGANVRSDVQRREAGTMRMYRSYRRWVLHVWDLSGPADTWGTQLDALYHRQPVFALIGGLGVSNWQPIHAFSERFEIPSVFPQVDMPALTDGNQYNFYLSRSWPHGAGLQGRCCRRNSVSRVQAGAAVDGSFARYGARRACRRSVLARSVCNKTRRSGVLGRRGRFAWGPWVC
jgi:mono/diheme cytochrome c family protein